MMGPTEETVRGASKETSRHSESDAEANEIATAAKAYTVGGDGDRSSRFSRDDEEAQGAE